MEQLPEVISLVVTGILVFISNKVREYINSSKEEKNQRALKEKAIRLREERDLLLNRSENVIENALTYISGDETRTELGPDSVEDALKYVYITAPDLKTKLGDEALRFMIKRSYKQRK